MTEFEHIVTNTEQSHRIDKLMTRLQQDVSRSKVQTWINNGNVTVNGAVVKSHYKCLTGDQIHWNPVMEKPRLVEPESLPLDIVFEDNDLMVINKSRHMVVHPAPGHEGGTLVNALLNHTSHLSSIAGEDRRGIVHRIDKDTSGLLVVAKHDEAHLNLAQQLADRTVSRQYEAIVHGVIDHQTGIIDAPIARDAKNRQKMAVADEGKEAVTHFHVSARYPAFTHLTLKLDTGRTHQIRVHMKYIGHPVIGDPKYGPRKTLQLNGQALHANSIGFTHPTTQKWIQFDRPAPTYFQDLLKELPNMY